MKKTTIVLLCCLMPLSSQAHETKLSKDAINNILRNSLIMYQNLLLDVCLGVTFEPSCKLISEGVASINSNIASLELNRAQILIVNRLNAIKKEADKQQND